MQMVSRFELVPVSEIRMPASKAHGHPSEQIAALRQSLRTFGLVVPLLIDARHNLVDGAAVLLAAAQEGATEVPCAFVEHLDDINLMALRLTLNRLQELGTWDKTILSDELVVLRDAGFDITLTGFSEDNILIEPLETSEDDFDPTPPEKPVSKPGDIWQLGRHRLLVGDAADAKAVNRLFSGKSASMFLTDPPYGVDYVGKTERKLKLQNDDLDADFLMSLLKLSFTQALEHLDPGSAFYIWHPDGLQALTFRQACSDSGLHVRQCLVWVKPSAPISRQDYHWRHEPCLYGWTPGASHHWYADQKQTTVLEYPRPTRSEEHPTMKPVSLFGYCIQNSTRQDAIVYDPFAGSGTTVIACEQLKRSAYCVELDSGYADVIVRRWESQTGQKAVKA